MHCSVAVCSVLRCVAVLQCVAVRIVFGFRGLGAIKWPLMCACVYMYVCMFNMFVCLHICMHTYVHHTHEYITEELQQGINTCSYVCMYVRMRVYMYVYVRVPQQWRPETLEWAWKCQRHELRASILANHLCIVPASTHSMSTRRMHSISSWRIHIQWVRDAFHRMRHELIACNELGTHSCQRHELRASILANRHCVVPAVHTHTRTRTFTHTQIHNGRRTRTCVCVCMCVCVCVRDHPNAWMNIACIHICTAHPTLHHHTHTHTHAHMHTILLACS